MKHTKQLTFAVPPEVREQVEMAASREMLSLSSWLRRTVAAVAAAAAREPEATAR
jgi:predicted HicB family RNase H-like nuclease